MEFLGLFVFLVEQLMCVVAFAFGLASYFERVFSGVFRVLIQFRVFDFDSGLACGAWLLLVLGVYV